MKEESIDPLKYQLNKIPVCPHCDEEINISSLEWYDLYDYEDDHYKDCPYCELPFKIVTNISFTFSTEEL